MSSAILIKNALAVFPGSEIRTVDLLIQNGLIAAIDPDEFTLPRPLQVIDVEHNLLTPGLVDIHTHGIHEHLFEQGPEHLVRSAEVLPKYGTTCVLPTLYTIMQRDRLRELEQLAHALDSVAGAAMPGFHLEGPFLALAGAGGGTLPGDVGLLNELLAATRNRTLAMSVSPDTINIIPVIERLHEANVAVFLTHTRASVEQTSRAIEAGARHATHFYDVFPPPEETDAGVRPVGAVETILANEHCTVDFICDGVHVHPMAIQAAIKAKGWRGVVAISDSNIGAGLEPGVYPSAWGYSVRVRPNDAARVATEGHPLFGKLAGSSLTMNVATANVLRWLDLPSAQAWALSTRNPAAVVGMHSKGTLDVGADADLVQWDSSENQLLAVRTWVGGRCMYDSLVPSPCRSF
jgi:N-acetylglucosamine-6-phosphate deacetylase